MSLKELDEKRKAAQRSVKKAYEYLKFLELNNIHRSRDVVVLGTRALEAGSVPHKNKWRLAERIVMCALEMNEFKTAKKYIHELSSQFNDSESKRVSVLKAMFYEAHSDYETASKKYLDKILAEAPSHKMSLKRKISMCIGARNRKLAVKYLNDYLAIHGSDKSAWKVLFDLQMHEHNYEYARFALEELLLMNATDYLLHMQYAEVLYTVGGDANCALAVKYFSQALLLSGDSNVRALYGLILAVRSLRDAEWPQMAESERVLVTAAIPKIMHTYAASNSPLVDVAKELLLEFNPEK